MKQDKKKPAAKRSEPVAEPEPVPTKSKQSAPVVKSAQPQENKWRKLAAKSSGKVQKEIPKVSSSDEESDEEEIVSKSSKVTKRSQTRALATKGSKQKAKPKEESEEEEDDSEEDYSQDESEDIDGPRGVVKKWSGKKPESSEEESESESDEPTSKASKAAAKIAKKHLETAKLSQKSAKSSAVKGKAAQVESESEEDESEPEISTKPKSIKKPVASKQKQQLFEDSDEDEEEESKPHKQSKTVATKAKPKSKAAKEEGEEESESEDEDDMPTGKSSKLTMTDSEDDEDEEDEDIRLTHGGEELEDDERDAGEYESEEEGEEEGEEGMEVEEEEEVENLTPAEVAKRISDTAAALADFKAYKKRTKTTMSRAQHVTRLSKDCASYYGYLPDLIDLFLTLFGPTEMVEFLEANETPRPTCIRANTLKTTRRELAKALTARGIGLEPVADWTNVGLKVFESEVPIGATPEYLAGHYMIQSPSSFTPVMALDPRPGEKVLDMCAAPGGKSSHIAQLMRNEGLLIANDSKLPRMDALVANLARLGVKIASCIHQDGREYPKVLGGFDRVLLDAPCSGLGVISHDPSVKQSRTLQDIQATSNLQRELLLAAIDACDHKSKEGGVIVYSTCSISVQENEQIVQFALDKRDVVLVDCGFEFGKPGLTRWQGKLFHPSMKLCKRLYPHTHNMDGFFVAKLRKRSNAILENGKPITKKNPAEGEEKSQKNGSKKHGDADDADDTDSVDSIEERRRKKQSNFAKRKNAKLRKRMGVSPGGAGGGGGKPNNKPTENPNKKARLDGGKKAPSGAKKGK